MLHLLNTPTMINTGDARVYKIRCDAEKSTYVNFVWRYVDMLTFGPDTVLFQTNCMRLLNVTNHLQNANTL